ncbi:cytochrome C [Nocardioides mangrovicus]|uniref:Cytochrome bc1 complex cytochrome c subunit n=1 Tax=Nocardioides mangrovicus TaxID=2478913 RepID=A0A3L8P323_9ACTN|nr:cytochrome C [Nocardioides mangrovicus]
MLLIGLLATGATYYAVSPASASGSDSSTDAVAKGRNLFLVGCASCHGQNGEGIVTKRGKNYGPSLIGVGGAAVDFQVGTGRMPMAAPGPQAPEKKVTYSKTEISQLAAYVASLGPGESVPSKSDYDTSGYGTESIRRGGELFRTNCTACHNFAGSGGALPGGKYAPKLVGVSSKHIYEALLTGPQQMPVFSNDVLTPQDKRDIISYLKKNERTQGYGGFSMGALGPVSEGMFAWLAGIGVLVGFAVWIASHTARVRKREEGTS